MPKLTYKTDPDMGLIEFYVNDELLTQWGYEDNAEEAFDEFQKVYMAGAAAFKKEMLKSTKAFIHPHIEGTYAVFEKQTQDA